MAALQFIGGLAFFLFGIHAMGKELSGLAGGKLAGVLARMCRTPLRGVLFGALVTAAIQSSTATTVMVVGFVNAGLMTLAQAVGVIMGANLGTTLTAWLLSLSGVSASAPWLRFLGTETLSPLLAAVGAALLLFGKHERARELGTALFSFGVLFAGMDVMTGAVAPLADNPAFTGILTLFENPIAGLLAGAALTAVIQSSSASVGILQAMSATGAITVGTAIPIVMGQNVGTCVTALLSAAGTDRNAKRAAFVHLYFNAGGAALLLALFFLLRATGAVDAARAAHEEDIALIHTLFNVAAVVLLLPFSRLLVRLATLTVPECAGAHAPLREQITLLDDRFLGSPSFALGLSRAAFLRMAELSAAGFLSACRQTERFDETRAREEKKRAELAARYGDSLATYLVKLSGTRQHQSEAAETSLLLTALPDVARIADRAAHAAENAARMYGEGLSLSGEAVAELEALRENAAKLFSGLRKLLRRGDGDPCDTLALADALEERCAAARARHVARLRAGFCRAESGVAYTSLLCDAESVAAHGRRLAMLCARRSFARGGDWQLFGKNE